MEAPEEPPNEPQRLATLRALGLLDTPAEERFDRITRMAQRLFDVPIALVSLVDEDRQWFKSRIGLDVASTPRSLAFCAHAIIDPDRRTMVVDDAWADERFADNPLVAGDPNIRFYAGAPIAAPDGAALGTLCVIDRHPRQLTAEDERSLRDLADLVEREIASVEASITDNLTGLTNQRGFVSIAETVLAVCRRRRLPATVVYADMDNLKPINDRLGHAAGDAAIKEVADLLSNAFRTSDVIARVGGDEFAILLSDAPDADAPLERLAATVTERNLSASGTPRLEISVGVASTGPDDRESLGDLIARADAAMYADKRSRRVEKRPCAG